MNLDLNKLGIILFPSTRSLAFLDILRKNNIILNEVIVMGAWPFLSNDFINVECENGNCTAERVNENERLDQEGEGLIIENDELLVDVSDDFPYPDKGQSFLKEGEVPRPKKIFYLGHVEIFSSTSKKLLNLN